MLLQDRVAIVSGVGPGMGRDISLAFAREGADVVLAARTPGKLESVAAEVEALGRRALCVPTDITVEDQCHALAKAAVDKFGHVDVLVNNAFVQPPLETIEDNDMKTWRKGFEVNVFGTIQMTKAVLPAMKEQGKGSIVFINSMSARRIQPEFGIYAAAKSALLTAVQTLAREVGPYGIRVNSVLPGYIWGDSVEWYFRFLAEQEGITAEEKYDQVASETCLHHLPTSAEIADSVVFFASDLSRVVTGQSLDVNAGHWFA
ncbi:MAG: SDR family oxidoreductase [Acidimicrobiales bacterium]|nr:SDR family oxidoreductase [Acidimicrobiales bacterium]